MIENRGALKKKIKDEININKQKKPTVPEGSGASLKMPIIKSEKQNAMWHKLKKGINAAYERILKSILVLDMIIY